MLTALVLAMFFSAQKGLKADIDEKGQLIAAALAESSQYGVIAENKAVLEQTMRMLAATDNMVVRLIVVKVGGEILASFQTPSSVQQNIFEFSHPIFSQPINANFFDSATQPHMPKQFQKGDASKDRSVLLGYAKVGIVSAPLLRARHREIYSALVLAGLAAFCGGMFGLVLAKRIEQPLAEVMRAVTQIRQGHYDIQLKAASGGELGELQHAVLDMSQALASQWQHLESLVAQRTEELQKANVERGKLIAHGNMLLEAERKRIAMDIHDQLNPSLVAVRLAASALASSEVAPISRDEVKKLAGEIFKIMDDIYANARRIVKSLRPEIMDTLGFNEALAELVRQFNGMQKQCHFGLIIKDGTPKLSGDVAISAYRVVQEGLSNVVKHAQATETVVIVDSVDLDKVRLVVKDNGLGFEAENDENKGFGLIGIKERVTYYGGSFSVKSDSSGTILCAEFPVKMESGDVSL
jgi:two-component system sensor histidine kinase UhpB